MLQSVKVPRKARVLVVDDNRDHLSMLATLLRALNQQVQVASNGPAALWIAAHFKPEVVYLDLSMPQMNGYDVAKALREQPDCQATRIIALTGMDSEEKHHAQAAGCDLLLRKPASLADIAGALDEVGMAGSPQ